LEDLSHNVALGIIDLLR